MRSLRRAGWRATFGWVTPVTVAMILACGVTSARAAVTRRVYPHFGSGSADSSAARRSVASSTPAGIRALARGGYSAADSLADSTGSQYTDANVGLAAYPVIVPETNERVQSFLRMYTGSRRRTFQGWLNRSGPYFPLVAKKLADAGVPIELACVVFIESGFNLGARSWAQAVGPWQFIAGTARLFGLSVTRDIDERHDIERSTEAAAKMFARLYDRFGSWPLSLAAYNCGDGCVGRAVGRQRTSDFWSLRLPNETQNYVAQFMAVLLILRNPEQYGFTLPGSEPLVYREAHTTRRTNLAALARRCGVEAGAVTSLNPAYRNGWAPSGATLRLPLAVAPDVANDALAIEDAPAAKPAPRNGPRHRIRERERSDAGHHSRTPDTQAARARATRSSHDVADEIALARASEAR